MDTSALASFGRALSLWPCIASAIPNFPGTPAIIGRRPARLESTPPTAGMRFRIRDYRPADFDRLWHIDQLCFPPGIAYTQMGLSGFITRRNAITLVGELSSEGPRADASPIAGFVVAHPVRARYGRILTLDILPEARRFGLATSLMLECERRLRSIGCTDVYLE